MVSGNMATDLIRSGTQSRKPVLAFIVGGGRFGDQEWLPRRVRPACARPEKLAAATPTGVEIFQLEIMLAGIEIRRASPPDEVVKRAVVRDQRAINEQSCAIV